MAFPIEKFSKGENNGRPVVPVCCVCLKVRTVDDKWCNVFDLLPKRIALTHTYCPQCKEKVLEEIGGKD